MNSNGVIAIVAAVSLGFIVRVFNIVVEWLARVMKVKPPTPIENKNLIDPPGYIPVQRKPEAPE